MDEYIFRRTFEWDRLVGIVFNETRRLGCFRPTTFIHPNLALNFKFKNHIASPAMFFNLAIQNIIFFWFSYYFFKLR